PLDAVPVARHGRDVGALDRLEAALHHVDDEQGVPADDRVSHALPPFPPFSDLSAPVGLEQRGGPGHTFVGLPGFYPSVSGFPPWAPPAPLGPGPPSSPLSCARGRNPRCASIANVGPDCFARITPQ